MKVSRKSWHYRLHVFVWTMFDLDHGGPIAYFEDGYRNNHKPRSLCTYFWSTAILTLLFPIWGFLLLLVLLILSVIFLLVIWPHRKYRSVRPKAPSAKNKEPGLVKSFVKAKKSKVCPLIEVTD
jgi:fatty acid desaturase